MSKHSKGVPDDVHPMEQTSSKEAVHNEEPDSSSARGTLPVPDKEIPSQNTSVLEKVDMLAAQCKANKPVDVDEGWTKVGKGKGKDLGEQPVSHALDFPSSSNPILSKGDGQKSEIAEKGKEIQVEVNEQSEKSAQDINVTEEEMAKPDKNKQVASLSGSEREGSDDVSMEIISDDFDRPVVSPKAPPDKKQSSNKKKKKR
ncbi:hypothetical protein U1Q18_042453 [Sarracenia purpurea var. burkii]